MSRDVESLYAAVKALSCVIKTSRSGEYYSFSLEILTLKGQAHVYHYIHIIALLIYWDFGILGLIVFK